MAVKFSEFQAKQDASVDVTEVVGYLTSGELNVRIPPANLDTTYAVSTGNAGASPTISLQGTKPGQAAAITPSTVSLTGLGGTVLVGDGSNAISFTSTTYDLTATDTSPAGTVPLVLGKTGGGDLSGDNIVNLIGAGGIGITSSSNTVTITGTASSTTYSLDVPSATTNINLAGSDGSNDAITLVGGTEIQLVRDSGSQITINSQAASYSSWTVAGDTGNTVVNSGETATIAGGTGINTAEVNKTVTVNIDYAGADNAILGASTAQVVAADTIWFSDATDTTIKKGLVSDLPFNETLDEVTTAGSTTANTINVGGGTASSPGYGINTDPNTGMFSNGADILGLATGGAAALTVDATQNATFNSLGAVTLASGTTANRNDAAIIPTAVDGMIRYNTTTNGFEGYINGAWGSIGGGVTIDKKQFAGTGSQTVFNLASTAAGLTVNNLAIYISGVYQNKLDASDAANFTVGAGANPDVTFSTAPPLTAANGIEIVITR